jgi:3',5'-cyclic AMP phosphodiesterase CpdA
MMTTMTLTEALARAEAAGACQEALDAIGQMADWDEFFRHPNAPFWAYWFSHHVIRGRWVEAEAAIATDAMSAYYYARDVLESRWPEAEAVISANTMWAHRYARDVMWDPTQK